MIENFLIKIGMGCGTTANFSTVISERMRIGDGQRWYFRTPVKVSGSGLKSAVLDMAYPFLAIATDINEKTAIERIELVRKNYEDDLLLMLRSYKFIVPTDSANFYVIPNWVKDANPRDSRRDFVQRIHIINASITVKYRESWFNSNFIDTKSNYLQSLMIEQSNLDSSIAKLTACTAETQEERDIIVVQLEAMNDYNNSLKSRILLLNT